MGKVSKHWLQGMGLRFWLPLPLSALFFWLSCSLIANQVLSRSYDSKDQLQADAQLDIHVSVNVMMIEATISRAKQIAQVEVRTTESILKTLEFEFPITDIDQVETAIAQELDLSRQVVRKLAL